MAVTSRKLFAVCDDRREVIAIGSGLGEAGAELVDHLWRGIWCGARAAVTHEGDVRVRAYLDVTSEAKARLGKVGKAAATWDDKNVVDAEFEDAD